MFYLWDSASVFYLWDSVFVVLSFWDFVFEVLSFWDIVFEVLSSEVFVWYSDVCLIVFFFCAANPFFSRAVFLFLLRCIFVFLSHRFSFSSALQIRFADFTSFFISSVWYPGIAYRYFCICHFRLVSRLFRFSDSLFFVFQGIPCFLLFRIFPCFLFFRIFPWFSFFGRSFFDAFFRTRLSEFCLSGRFSWSFALSLQTSVFVPFSFSAVCRILPGLRNEHPGSNSVIDGWNI